MTISQEMFRFVTTRRPERVLMHRINSRLIRDRRQVTQTSLVVALFGPGAFEDKLRAANRFAAAADFVASGDPQVRALEPAEEFFRGALVPDAGLVELGAEFTARCPMLSALLENVPPADLLAATTRALARIWDSFYAQTIRGCDSYVSTNYLADALRFYHVLRLLWLSRKVNLATWAGGSFDDYEVLIDLNTAAVAAGGSSDSQPDHPTPGLPALQSLQTLSAQLAALDSASARVLELQQAGAVHVEQKAGARATYLTPASAKLLRHESGLRGVDLLSTPVDQIQQQLHLRRTGAAVEREQALAALAGPAGVLQYQQLASQVIAEQPPAPSAAAAFVQLALPGSEFRVPLTVGAIKPPTVGDLMIVEQDLARYELGELADIQSIMRGERRERTLRNLARTTQTTATETSSQEQQSSSLTTDERFALSTQAQKTAGTSTGVQIGVTASGKFGPVQVGASVNASFDTSKSSSETASQDYAKTVTEEASKVVQSSFKQSSSITILTESQDTLLRGFNNESGTAHVNGLYRWVDKIYSARLLNYGRRLMLALTVPEPGAYFRGLLGQQEDDLLADLVEPVPLSLVSPSNGLPYSGSATGSGIQSYLDISEQNYANAAALYAVTDVVPPPPERIFGSKSIAIPTAMEAGKVETHSDEGNELSYVAADNTLTVDPNYWIDSLGVFVPQGGLGTFHQFADCLKLGQGNDVNHLLLEVGNQQFYFHATGQGNKDGPSISTNFNEMQPVRPDDPLAAVMQAALPVTITADFEGIAAMTIMFSATRRIEALQQWQAQTYAAIVKGYNARLGEYQTALTEAQAKAQAAVDSQTLELRDDQYRSIELTELKRGCIDLLTEGTATGYTSIAVSKNGTPRIVFDAASGSALKNWRAPLANGSVTEFFELAFEWPETTYEFYPYYWTAQHRWPDLAQAAAADPVFEQFLRAGSAGVVVPVRPGYERSVMLFLKTGLIWGGGYLPLFTAQDMLDVYADVELGVQLDPPQQVGDAWEVRLPTSMLMLQEDSTLPTFDLPSANTVAAAASEPVPDESVPF